jgi:predicted Zn-dependent protease
VQNYPRETAGHVDLGVAFGDTGDVEHEISEMLQAIQLDPTLTVAYGDAADGYMLLGKFDEARSILNQAFAHKLDTWPLRRESYVLARAQNDAATMQRDMDALKSSRGGQVAGLRMPAEAKAGGGELKAAAAMFRAAEQKAQELGRSATAEGIRLQYINDECQYGLVGQAQSEATAVLPSLKDDLSRLLAAGILARCGDAPRAKQILDEVLRANPKDTFLNAVAGPNVVAQLHLRKGSAAQAIEDLTPAATYGRYDVTTRLLRTEAYLEASQPAKAAEEVQWSLSQKQSAPGSEYKFAQILAARAYAAQGDKTRAREMYQDVLAAWKNADPGLPLVEKVKAEYAKLQ